MRPALELALEVARIGAAASPPVPPPRAVKPFVRFSRLPEQAWAAVRRALDEDEAFRARVEALSDEAELGRPGWLFVARPDGWEEELAQLSEEARARAEAEREEREERSARRRLTRAEKATQRAESAAAGARAEAAKAEADLLVERRQRRAAQEEAAKLARRATSVEADRDTARRQAADATAEVERLRAEAQLLRTQLEAVGRELHALRGELAAQGPPPADPAAPAAPAAPVADPAAVARAVAAAAAAAESLSRALVEASAALGGDPGARGGDRPSPPGAAGGATLATPDSELRPGTRPPAPLRRHAPTLPPAVFDDTVEAANHLVRVPGVLVLVDGYNVAKALWPDVEPIELRERLLDAVSELEARTGAGIHVVFDGADLGGPPPRPSGRRRVRVTFSAPDVEADDVILDLVEHTPVERPVVVASSDRRVQEGAAARGAGVISSARLAAVLGRA